MIILPAIAWSVLAAQPLDRVEIPVLHMRASRVLEKMAGLSTEGVTLTPEDEKSVIVAEGNPDDIKTVRTYIQLFDIARRRVKIDVTLDSILDKVSFESSGTVFNSEEWQTTDGDLGITLGASPRYNDDNTVTLFLKVSTATIKSQKMVVRVKPNEFTTFSIAEKELQVVPDINHLPKNVKPLDPKLRIKVDIPSGIDEFGRYNWEPSRPASIHPF